MSRSPISFNRTYPALAILLTPLLAGCPTQEQADLSPRPQAGEQHLFRLAHITDPQIVDEESPARLVRFTGFNTSAWRPQEAYGIHTLDATLRAVNQIHAEGRDEGHPVDFVVITGDLADLAQQNELSWFVDTMDGAVVTADSGDADGVDRETPPDLNPKLPYDAEGLSHEIPWYTCFGNHDGLAVGTFPVNRTPPEQEDWFAPLLGPVAELTGLHALARSNNDLIATSNWSPAVLLGSGPPLVPDTSLRLDVGSLVGGAIAPDPQRRFLSKRDFIATHLNSTSQPPGHGFTQASLDDGETYYSVQPVPGVPLRLITFDTVADTDRYGFPFHFGVLTRRHFEQFIKPELEAAANAGDWVVLASHHPADDFDLGIVGDRVRAAEFRAYVASFPNIIMHLNGHTHRHRAEIVDGDYPYLEISTTAIIDFPQESRLLDVYLQPDGQSLRIESAIFSHRDAPTPFSEESYRRAQIAATKRAETSDTPEDAKAWAAGTAQDRSFSIKLAR